jgi:dynactin complex subunit
MSSKTKDLEGLRIGAECLVDDKVAWIRYIGPVVSAANKNPKAIWLGLEWEEQGRGTHDGSLENKVYFSCLPGHGSFVHPKRAKPLSSFLEALTARYQNSNKSVDDLFLLDKQGKHVNIQFVGEHKIQQQQAQLDRLEKVTLSDMSISSEGPPGDIKRVCPIISSLDLSRNCLRSWERVVRSFKQFVYIYFFLFLRARLPRS